MATYSTDLTTLTTAESGTWTEFDSPYNGAGSPAADGENFIQGTDCYSQTTGKANGLVISIVFDYGSGYTFATDEVVIAWCFYAVGVNLETYANGGWRFGIGSAITTVDFYDIGGSDYGRNPYGGWVNIVIDPTVTADYTLGGGNGGTYRYFGSVPYTINEITKGTPSAVDAIRAGRGEISVIGTGGSFSELASYNDWNSTATPPGTTSTVLDSGYHRLGLFQDQGGTYLWKGLLSLGTTASSVTFTDSNETIIIDDSAKTYLAFNKVEINNASSTIDLTNITFISTGTVAPGTFEMVANATVDLAGCTFNDMGTFDFLSNATIGSTFNSCGLITQGGATFTGSVVNNGTASASILADDVGLITNCDFTSDGSNHAIELTTAHAAGSYNLTNLTYTGYTAASTGNEAIYNNSGGAVTLSVSGGDSPSIRDGTGASTSIQNFVTVRVEGVSEGAAVTVLANETVGTLTIGDVILQGLADSTGALQITTLNYEAAFGTGLDVVARVRASGLPTAAIQDDNASYTDQTTAANSATTNDMNLLPTTPVVNEDGFIFGHAEQFTGIKLDIGTIGTGGFTITWQYWNGAWTSLSGVIDGTSNLTNLNENTVSWTSPGDWATTTLGGLGPYYYIRALYSAGTVTIVPLGRKCKLDVTKYLPFNQNRTITSSGLTVTASWTVDTIATF